MPKELFSPASVLGAVFYAAILLAAATLSAALLRGAVGRILKRDERRRIDRTYALFLTQLGVIAIYGLAALLYVHLIPALHTLANVLLTGAGVASLTLGLAAQNSLGNLIAGVGILLYRPFGVGDTIVVAVPGGSQQGVVERISLGYTILSTKDSSRILVPNGVAFSQTIINLTPDGG